MSVSLLALLAGGSGQSAHAGSPPVLSPGWLGATVAARSGARSPAAAAQPGTGIPANSVHQVQQSVANLARAAQAIVQAQAVQAQAVRAALGPARTVAAAGVADGLTIGGLEVDPGVTAAATALWNGANLPTQSAAPAGVAVKVVQTQSKAVLNWKTFNVGASTALNFDQSAGGTGANTWVVLNRVNDPAAQPSRVLGSITAQGEVLLLNRNGILFGAGSQVNVNALIASTASLADAQFRSTGVFSTPTASGYAASLTGALGAIAVEAGAKITTNAPQTAVDRGGFVWLLGSSVRNDGAITSNNGQTILAAGHDFILRPGSSAVVNPISTTLGAEIAVNRGGGVTNTGLIQASTGDITLAGQTVLQAGTIVATTSLAQRGTIHLLTDRTDIAGSVTLAAGSNTLIVTDTAAATAIDAQRASFLSQSAANNSLRAAPSAALLNNQAPLADRQDESRVEITTGGTVTFGATSLTLATGGQIAVSARARILAETGALLDVAGSPDVVLPASANGLKVNLQGFELRDSAANRDSGALTSQTVNIDITQLVAVAPGAAYGQTRYYTAGGLAEIGGELGNVGHTIREWTLPGGTINLAGGDVVAQPGAVFNLAGGSVRYTPGLVATSWLFDAAGRLYNINTAPSNIAYAGVYGGFDVRHARWGITDIFNSPLVAPAQIFHPGYSVGRDGGSLTLGAPSVVFEAQIEAGVIAGERQIAARPALVADPYLLPQITVALPGGLIVANSSVAGGGVPYASDVRITAAPTPLAASLDATTPLPADRRNSVFLDAGQISAAGLGGLAIATAGRIAIDAPITLAAGAPVVLAAPSTHLSAALTARAGSVTIGNRSAQAPAGGFLESTGGVDVVLSSTAAIDTRGVFTNRPLDPGNVAGQGFVNGGAVTIDSSQQVVLAAGSGIDASSGGAVLSSQKNLGGQGGSISITAWDPADPNPVAPGGPPVFAIAATLRSYGSAKGGGLSLNVPAVFIGDDPSLAPAGALTLAPAFFGAGFSTYAIDGYSGVAVAPASRIAVTEPIYQFGPASLRAPPGSDPAAAFDLVLPPLYTPNPVAAVLTQRPGASLILASVTNAGSSAVAGGSVTIGQATSITVDPGAKIGIEAFGQITVNGTLTAPAGAISVLNDRAQANALGQFLTYRPGLSIWLGPNSRLDVSARAATAPDAYGRPYGIVPAGGAILLGSAGGTLQDYAISTDAFIVTRPGSQLDASGASAVVDAYAGTTPLLNALHRDRTQQAATNLPVRVASAGGSITLNTESGADLQGGMRAAAGGAGAEGGTLGLTLLTPVYGSAGFLNYAVPDALRLPREVLIGQSVQTSALAADLKPADPASPFAFGQIRLSADQIAAGRFDTLAIVSGDRITFDGAVALQAGRAVRLAAGTIGETQPGADARIAAPYVGLTGLADTGGGALYPQFPVLGKWTPSSQVPAASLIIAGDTIDVAGNLYGGIRNEIALAALTPAGAAATLVVDQRGFAAISLASSGDIRFLPGPTGGGTSLTTPGNLSLTAGQIYPVAGAAARVTAGFDFSLVAAGVANPYLPDGVITIARSPGPIPPAPLTAGGSLSFKAGEIDQGGILRAPQGQIALGAIGGIGVVSLRDAAFTYAVKLLPGSVTSVSAAGLSIPYGGTSDGITYSVNGAAATLATPTIALGAQTLQVAAGATLDLSGGGQLVGAAFVFGRGGSTDVLTSPLLRLTTANTISAPTLATNPVYAILPAANPSVAPPASTAAAYAGSVPKIGDQISIGDGVPGLAAGTYTLLPGSDALLPGAFRVELNTARAGLLTGPLALGNGSTLINGYRIVANTAFRDALPTVLTVSPGTAVRRYAQYDERNYSQFVTARAALFGSPRGGLPQDAKQLVIGFPAALASASAGGAAPPALSQNGTVLFQPAQGGYGGTAIVGAATDLEITPDSAVPSAGYVSLRASDLNRLGASTLSIGGVAIPTLTPSKLQFQLDIGLGPSVRTNSVTLRGGAVLSAPQVFLVGGIGGLTIEQGAGINTLGLGAPAFDSANGFVYDNGNLALLAVSNGALTFLPPETAFSTGPVSIGACAQPSCAGTTALYSDGTIGLVTGGGVTLDPSMRFGTRILDLGVASVNIGSAAALAGVPLPPGLTLNNDILGPLLAGDPVIGTPALQQLTLTANQSINFYGSIDLTTIDPVTEQSSLKLLQFNTPAIYGAGSAADAVTISTGTFVWNGLATTVPTPLGSSALVSATPGGIVAGGAGTGAGHFSVRADRIVLGYGPSDQADNNTRLDRLMLGFADVTLTGTSAIAANNRGSLSVYQTQTATYLPASGFVNTGGNLTLATPVLTGGAGSVNAITAGGALRVVTPVGVPPAAASQGALGAEIDLAGNTIDAATMIALPSGRLTLNATGDVTLGAGTRIDAGGRQFTLFDQTRATFGGDVALTSAAGNVVQQPGASIDISAAGAAAGSLSITATAPGAGHVALGGPVSGGAGAGFTAGSFDIRAQSLDFDAINASLNAGGVVGSRSFDIKTGNLVIGDGLVARKVIVAVDGGSLTVTGTIAASGAQPGSIRLAARDGLTLAGTAVLDAHGTALRVDSAGQPIAAANRGQVELSTSGAGSVLTLAPGAVIDLSTPDGVAYGHVILNAPRAGANDVGITAPGAVAIRGAASIALNAFRAYAPSDAAGTITQHDLSVTDPADFVPGSVNLDAIDADSTAFILAAGANGSLAARLAGLAAYGAAFHLRPGVEIDSSAASGGNLTVSGDLDLSAYRYPAYGAPAGLLREPGALLLRAADNLRVFGSISDGFGQPPDPGLANPDDQGWFFNLNSSGVEVTGSRIVLSSPATLLGSTNPALIGSYITGFVNNDVALNYDIRVYFDGNGVDAFGNPAAEGVGVRPSVALPAAMTLEINNDGTVPVVPAGTVLTAAITLPSGVVYPAGTIVAAGGLTLSPGTVLDAGSRLPVQVTLAVGSLWPAGASLAGFASSILLSASTAPLPPGSLIPAGTNLALGGACPSPTYCMTRPSVGGGPQGAIYAIAPMLAVLADGSLPQSWSLRLVGGADLAAADPRVVGAPAALPAASGSDPQPGSIVLSDLHYQITPAGQTPPAWSVIRTGTGDLELLAGGGVQQNSQFGIYTAGNAAPAGAGVNLPRGTQPGGSTVLGSLGAPYEPLVSGTNYQAYYPDHGGDVLVAAQGSITGDLLVPTGPGTAAIDGVGSWLWRQGGAGQDTAWWINFGTYALPLDANGAQLGSTSLLTGFTGIGALGGGNVTLLAGGMIGAIQAQPGGGGYDLSQALDVAIGSTGRVIAAANGQPATTLATGGGDLTIRAGGAINMAGPVNAGANRNPTGYASADTALGGTVTDLRGQISVQAASIGQVVVQYGQTNPFDPRAVAPNAANAALSQGGLVIVPGDASVSIAARGDLVLGGVGDATRLAEQNLTPLGGQAGPGQSALQASGLTWFSLWQPRTSIALLSVGGNVTPSTQTLASVGRIGGATAANSAATDNRFVYPPVLDAVAASGSLYYGTAYSGGFATPSGLELAPSAAGQLQLLAAGSIFGNQYRSEGGNPQTISVSGADPAATATPVAPAYGNVAAPAAPGSSAPSSLFAFAADNASGTLHAGDPQPARFYAGQDIVNLRFGDIVCLSADCTFATASRLVAAKSASIRAGQDIVGFGLAPGSLAPAQFSLESTTGNLILNNNPNDVSILAAGRDIVYANLDIAGPGGLFVSAGRNLYQEGQGVLESTGTLNPNGQTRGGGAGITVLAGVGPSGPDFSGFANAYLNGANQRVAAGAPGVIQNYSDLLLTFLQTRDGYQGSAADALAVLQALPAEQRAGLLLQIYFDELRASGREFTDPASPRYKSYARGREAIAALFPNPVAYQGDVTLFDASGIRTDFGGAINLLTPGGQTVLGVASGPQPPSSAGVLTQGQGNIGIYSQGSVLLGQSRVFTTFGGSIVIWSETGDVNAGRGAKSTAVYTPSRIVYDAYGNLSLSPSVPTSGAGIATLSPIPGTSAGDVDLIAPLGTIDAGEAGIRVSGNVNLAALTVANASNVQVGGKSTGLPTVVAPNVGALSAATAASAAATQSAQQSAQNNTAANRQTPSTITVEVTGYGG